MPLRIRGIEFEDMMSDLVGTSHFKTGVRFSTR